MLSQIKSSQFLVNIAHFYACITSTWGVWNQWNGVLEWNGGMEHWNGIAKWFFQ